ncbi:MAG: hypothetical protein PHX27_04000 [Candidatus ainarchaeum sp.]|nr:hypothetical protein [Candidatus ainarchaeum sp.]
MIGIFSNMNLLLIGEIFADLNLVLKILVLLAIFGYVTQHLGKGPLAILIIVGMGYFIIFDYWKFFGGVYVLYMLIVMGIGGIVIDFLFITPGAQGKNEGPISHGRDFTSRQGAYQKLRGGGR